MRTAGSLSVTETVVSLHVSMDHRVKPGGDERTGGGRLLEPSGSAPSSRPSPRVRGEGGVRVAATILRFVIASVSEAIQSGLPGAFWVTSSLSLLAMTRAERRGRMRNNPGEGPRAAGRGCYEAAAIDIFALTPQRQIKLVREYSFRKCSSES
jgi:hypothetical protein